MNLLPQHPKFTSKAIAAALVFSVAPCAIYAVSITDFVDTPHTLSFKFSGDGFGDFINLSLPMLTYWDGASEGHAQDPRTATYGFGFDGFRHLPDGTGAVLGGNAIPYGTTLSDTQTYPHGTALDTYTLSITVQNNGSGLWGEFSGSFSAVHPSTQVPDTGATGVLAGLGILGLAGLRKLRS
ncbi:MAG TPA: VPDSG-CTERM sorting domain-containing protein [Verrucomicrobiota bacterium]|nr:VPDSG-CTERM sorting domain-containing protein [Verrucomicrobiota bacterium]